LRRAENGGVAISFCSKDEHGIGKIFKKLIKVDVKTVSDHPYPWHSGNPETHPGGPTKPKIQISGGAP
jgi:ATP-dependent RNA helicase RhlE